MWKGITQSSLLIWSLIPSLKKLWFAIPEKCNKNFLHSHYVTDYLGIKVNRNLMSFKSLNASQSKSCSKEVWCKKSGSCFEKCDWNSMYMNIMYNDNYSVSRSWWVIHLKNAYHSKSGSQVACLQFPRAFGNGWTDRKTVPDRWT